MFKWLKRRFEPAIQPFNVTIVISTERDRELSRLKRMKEKLEIRLNIINMKIKIFEKEDRNV